MLYSLRSRLMLSFSILLIIPFTAVVFIFSRESANLIQSSIETSTMQTIGQFASHADTLLMQIEDTGKQVLSSPFTQQWITTALNGGNSAGERYLAMQQLRNFFSSYTVNNSNIISVSAFREAGGGIWTQDRSYLDSDWYNQYKHYNTRWTGAHRDPDQSDESMRESEVNSLIVPLVQLQSLNNIGVLKVNYPTSLLRGDIDKIRFGSSGRAFLLTGEGASVLDQNLGDSKQVLSEGLAYVKAHSAGRISGIIPLRQKDMDYLLFYRKLPAQNWIIIGEVPEAELYAKITQIKQTLLLGSLGLLVLVIAVALWLSIGITKPLSAMTRAMRHVKHGRFDLALQHMPQVRTRRSEVHYVASVFEQMTHRLKYLIETEFETDLRRKNAEYKALLLQINPHFFNNTLEIIGGLAAMKREDLVMDATEALAKMMRYSLDLDSDLVKVSEEIGYIRDYLLIQKLRHQDKLIFSIHSDPEAESLHIAKFILQPIVENAVKYSLEKGEAAEVAVSSELRDNRLWLTVKDNGIGMPQEMISGILADTELRSGVGILNDKGNSIGLRNTLSRCRLYYGDLFEITIESEEGGGTAITLKLPPVRS
ncbi:two-component system, sensor histidine kinase YesM [Paenibacillus sophorae]|uniref:histidine kinase n=1 Tax=Paenibacillus sophorae TaxID=1333845 RepID=A0A1H8U7Y0_9BACL|nr:sensor histidine kinase [Paenibacillus sophorae]QWU17993.1 histidine kinase [Paenibacillus sophorae]SEO99309.1 two-component system, sensor histidine kinase YesM [Paenibacillus sophorae]